MWPMDDCDIFSFSHDTGDDSSARLQSVDIRPSFNIQLHEPWRSDYNHMRVRLFLFGFIAEREFMKYH